MGGFSRVTGLTEVADSRAHTETQEVDTFMNLLEKLKLREGK